MTHEFVYPSPRGSLNYSRHLNRPPAGDNAEAGLLGLGSRSDQVVPSLVGLHHTLAASVILTRLQGLPPVLVRSVVHAIIVSMHLK